MKATVVTEQLNTEDIKAIVDLEGVSKSQKMKDLFDGGVAVKDIALAMGVRYNFAYNVIQNHCMVKGIEIQKTVRNGRREEIVAALKAGATLIEIAKQSKLQYNYVWKIAKEEGLTKKATAAAIKIETPAPVAVAEAPKAHKGGKAASK